MTDTLERTDVDSLEDLDFAPKCSVVNAYIDRITGKIIGRQPCGHDAKWAGNCPACGDVNFICEEHRKSVKQWRCSKHGTLHDDLVEWRRI